jgi:hypothetical protein
MTERGHERELEALKADIARLREELAGVTGTRRSAAEPSDATPPRSWPLGEEGRGVISEFLRQFETSRAQGEKVVKELAGELEHHPLASLLAAFGLGYIVAKLWHRERAQ